MKKIILLCAFTTLVLSSDAELLKRIEILEKELNTLKIMAQESNKQILKTVNENTKYIQETEPILEKIEKKSILDKVNFSPELELRMDKFDYRIGDIAGENTKIYDNIKLKWKEAYKTQLSLVDKNITTSIGKHQDYKR